MKLVKIAQVKIEFVNDKYFSLTAMKEQVNSLETKSDFVKKVFVDRKIKNFEILYIPKFLGSTLTISSFLKLNKNNKLGYKLQFNDESIKSVINKVIEDSLAEKSLALDEYRSKIIEHADNHEIIESAYKCLPNLLFRFSKSSIPSSIEVFGTVHSVPVPDKSIVNRPLPKNYEIETTGFSRIRNISVEDGGEFYVEIDCRLKKSKYELKTRCQIRNSVLVKILNDIESSKNCYGKYFLTIEGEDCSIVDFIQAQQELDFIEL